MKWDELDWSQTETEIAKAYIFHRLESRSPHTVASDALMIKTVSVLSRSHNAPWSTPGALSLLTQLYQHHAAELAILFRVFYCWCASSGKPGFSLETYFHLDETTLYRRSSYESLFLHQRYVTPEQETLILRLIDESYDPDDWHSLQTNVILHLAFELAPRPSQMYALNADDLEVVEASGGTANEDNYFSLWLPLGKQRGAGVPERRPRRISAQLGKKIQFLTALNEGLFGKPVKALFWSAREERLRASYIGVALRDAMMLLDGQTVGARLMRHHLGQGLADQGASADVIAEALGHNSTVAARAYIAATPTIAKIKSRALGKSDSYKNIMKMMLTGDISDKQSFPKERWVKGVVHLQYVVGVGGCGLPANNHCPKNPIYSCYTCRKFHPFSDGPHEEVRSALEMQAQTFIDSAANAAELGRTRVPVQLEKTLEAVSAVVQKCREKLEAGNA
ncbi:hypothetical protein [Herbaspirillum sp. NPDC101397]|uniref:hypothetical protein n=1 Tax=Herbaspirillum sp. NPDC101397 TaxID=3364006 RepID=UPI003839E7E5